MTPMPLVITFGDPSGIGPEVTLKALARRSVIDGFLPLVFGSATILEHWNKTLQLKMQIKRISPISSIKSLAPFKNWSSADSQRKIFVCDLGGHQRMIKFGQPSAESGKLAGKSIQAAVHFCLQNKIPALVTAPVNKESLGLAGYRFTGHTEFLGRLCQVQNTAMFFVSDQLKVLLLTTHLPLKNVAQKLSVSMIIAKISLALESLRNYFQISKPRIGVCGLNPHAGDGGWLGTEENKIIIPALKQLRSRGLTIDGPISGDAIFQTELRHKYDLIVATYHDQGLIPVKLLCQKKAVNVTLGLPFIRTSPAHGTAYDLAGKGEADATNMVEAIKWAIRLAKTKIKSDDASPLAKPSPGLSK